MGITSDSKPLTGDIFDAGGTDDNYKGIPKPARTRIFMQTPEEEALYQPIMDDLVKKGSTDGPGISGI